jgi:hypothetical protein
MSVSGDGKETLEEHGKISIRTERVNVGEPPKSRVYCPLNRLFAIFQLLIFALDILV